MPPAPFIVQDRSENGSDIVDLKSGIGRSTGTLQVAIVGGTATVTIEGRLAPSLPWVQLTDPLMADTLIGIILPKTLRITVSDIAGGAKVSVALRL